MAFLYLEPGTRPGTGGNIPGLDGLRAISIFIVMVSHSGLQNVVPGVFGVTIFFFISGFLITSLLLNEREKSDQNNIALFKVLAPLGLKGTNPRVEKGP